jgi:hypothetical protein
MPPPMPSPMPPTMPSPMPLDIAGRMTASVSKRRKDRIRIGHTGRHTPMQRTPAPHRELSPQLTPVLDSTAWELPVVGKSKAASSDIVASVIAASDIAPAAGQLVQGMRLLVGRGSKGKGTYGWIGQESGSGFSDRPPATMGVFASLDRL